MSETIKESMPTPENRNTPGGNDEKEKDYILLREDFPNYDFSFKVIVIGNSGK